MTYKNIFKNSTTKQVLGALAGMGIAGILYIGIDQASYLSIKGLLVSTDSITENAGQVRVNAIDVNDATQRRLESRANAIAEQLASSASAASSSQIAETPLSNNVAARRAKRVFAHEIAVNFARAPTYSNDPNKVIPLKQRIAIRAAHAVGLPAPAFAPQLLDVHEGGVPAEQESASADTDAVADMATASDLHQAAAESRLGNTLPNSGLGLNLLVILALGCAFFSAKTHVRERIVALVSSRV